jgi:hypothetical protein
LLQQSTVLVTGTVTVLRTAQKRRGEKEKWLLASWQWQQDDKTKMKMKAQSIRFDQLLKLLSNQPSLSSLLFIAVTSIFIIVLI